MRFPWQRRADEEKTLRIAAQQRRAAAHADWPAVHRQVAELRNEKDLNGWTQRVKKVFEAYPDGRHS